MWAPAILAFSFFEKKKINKQKQQPTRKIEQIKSISCNVVFLFLLCKIAHPRTFNSINKVTKVIHTNPLAAVHQDDNGDDDEGLK